MKTKEIEVIIGELDSMTIKEFRKEFCTEEVLMCECGHSEESHYWNGGGDERYNGYDKCRADGCKCIHDEKKLVFQEVINKNEALEAFILKALDLARSAGKLKGYAQCRRDYEAIRMPDASLAKEGSKK